MLYNLVYNRVCKSRYYLNVQSKSTIATLTDTASHKKSKTTLHLCTVSIAVVMRNLLTKPIDNLSLPPLPTPLKEIFAALPACLG